MWWGLLIGAGLGGGLGWAYLREESKELARQHEQLRGGVSEPCPWGEVYGVPAQENPLNLGGSGVEPSFEPVLNRPLNLPEPRLNRSEPIPEPAQVQPELSHPDTGDGFPRFDQIEGAVVGRYNPADGGLKGVSGEFVEWTFFYEQGLNQAAIIWRLWGARKGGTERYKKAKARHDLFMRFIGDYEAKTQTELDDEQID